MNLTLSLAEVINVGLDRLNKSLRVCMPGRIESFNASEQTADVKPLLHDHTEAEDGSEGSAPVDVICRVPVHVAGGGGFAATFPIAKGDECLLVFGDRSLDNWFTKGGDQDPVDLRRHALSDAVAIVGLRSEPSKLADYDASRAVFGNKGPRVAADGTNLHLGVGHGEDASDFVALASLVLNRLQAIADKFDGHTHKLTQIIGTGSQVTPIGPVSIAPGGLTGDTDAPGSKIGTVAAVKSACVKSK